ncbi:MAG: hypothetical protein HDS71_06265 [Bacteroidales bacterium]|nr:hypothetical protein [Bacteroidales bacterium]MBD5223637.1 hypothetical protein [Bacteroidales bacterium]
MSDTNPFILPHHTNYCFFTTIIIIGDNRFAIGDIIGDIGFSIADIIGVNIEFSGGIFLIRYNPVFIITEFPMARM